MVQGSPRISKDSKCNPVRLLSTTSLSGVLNHLKPKRAQPAVVENIAVARLPPGLFKPLSLGHGRSQVLDLHRPPLPKCRKTSDWRKHSA